MVGCARVLIAWAFLVSTVQAFLAPSFLRAHSSSLSQQPRGKPEGLYRTFAACSLQFVLPSYMKRSVHAHLSVACVFRQAQMPGYLGRMQQRRCENLAQRAL
jgi:hypothetical protein